MKLLIFKRHWSKIWISAFFLGTLFCGTNDYLNNPALLDHIQQHKFNVFAYLPNIQQDYHNGNLIIDGALPVAVGSYQFFENRLENISDSTQINNSFFSYRQGDYLYRDFIAGKDIFLGDSLNLSIKAQARSFPGPFNNLGPQHGNSKNVLQNYHINTIKYFENKSEFYMDYFYHKENIGLPLLNTDIIKQFHESNNFGLGYNSNNDGYKLNTKIAFQNGDINSRRLMFEYLTIWSYINLSKPILSNVDFNLKFKNKMNYFEMSNSTFIKNNIHDFLIKLDYQKKTSIIQVGINSINKKIFGYFNYKMSIKNVFIESFYEAKSFFNMKNTGLDTLYFSDEIIGFYGVNFLSNNDFFNIKSMINLSYLGFKSSNYKNFIKAELQLKHKYFNIGINKFNSIFNEIQYGYLNSKLMFTPAITWKKIKSFENVPLLGIIFWNNEKRYKPFMNLEFNIADWVYSGFNEIGVYDLNELPEEQVWWNIGFGFDIQNFKFSWNRKYLGSNFIYFSESNKNTNETGMTHPIGSISYFQIDWRFLD